MSKKTIKTSPLGYLSIQTNFKWQGKRVNIPLQLRSEAEQMSQSQFVAPIPICWKRECTAVSWKTLRVRVGKQSTIYSIKLARTAPQILKTELSKLMKNKVFGGAYVYENMDDCWSTFKMIQKASPSLYTELCWLQASTHFQLSSKNMNTFSIDQFQWVRDAKWKFVFSEIWMRKRCYLFQSFWLAKNN